MKPFYTFGSRNDTHKLNMFSAVFLDKIHGSHGRTAGGQHGIRHNNGPLIDGAGKLAEIFMGLMGFLIPVKADMAYLGGGNQGKDSVYHAKSGSENRNHRQLLSGNHRRHAALDGSFHFNVFQRQIS